MTRSHGSAAVAARVASMPRSAVRSCVRTCIDHLGHTLDLARIAVESREPERAARYLVDTLDDLSADLRLLRAALKNHPTSN